MSWGNSGSLRSRSLGAPTVTTQPKGFLHTLESGNPETEARPQRPAPPCGGASAFHCDSWFSLSRAIFATSATMTAPTDPAPRPRAAAGQEGRRVFARHDRPWTLTGAPGGPVRPPVRASERADHTKAGVVVPVSGVVPVAVRRAEVPRVVVPGPAAENATSGGRAGSPDGRRDGSNHPPRKIAWRRRQLSACPAWATHAPTRRSISSRAADPARQRSRRPRSRLRKRRTLASGRRRRPPGSSTKPRNSAGARASAISVLRGCRRRRRPSRNSAMRRRHSSSCAGSSWNSAKSST